MNHNWENIQKTGALRQKCTRCGIIRKREAYKKIKEIIQIPPYYIYEYTSRWVYYVNGSKLAYRVPCTPVAIQIKSIKTCNV